MSRSARSTHRKELSTAFEAAADLLIAGHWLAWRFLDKRQFDDPMAVPQGIGLRGLAAPAEASGPNSPVPRPPGAASVEARIGS